MCSVTTSCVLVLHSRHMPSESENGKAWALPDDIQWNNCAKKTHLVWQYVFCSVTVYRLKDQGSIPKRDIWNYILTKLLQGRLWFCSPRKTMIIMNKEPLILVIYSSPVKVLIEWSQHNFHSKRVSIPSLAELMKWIILPSFITEQVNYQLRLICYTVLPLRSTFLQQIRDYLHNCNIFACQAVRFNLLKT